MSTVPHQPIPIPSHVDRDALAQRHALAVGRSPVVADIAEILEREGPRGIWRRMAERDEIPADELRATAVELWKLLTPEEREQITAERIEQELGRMRATRKSRT
jgi:hypothetical protein